jgi:hypothetical protein
VVEARSGSRDAGVFQQADGALARLCVGLTGRWVWMVSVSCRPMVYSGFSEVSGSWKIAPILRPRMWRICSWRQVVDALAFQQDLAAGDAPGRLQQADDGRAGQRLARAGLADHTQDFARRDAKEISSSARRCRGGWELDAQVLDF